MNKFNYPVSQNLNKSKNEEPPGFDNFVGGIGLAENLGDMWQVNLSCGNISSIPCIVNT